MRLIAMNVYLGLAIGVLMLHLLWIVWVFFGCLVTRQRPWLRWFHVASLIYSVFIEVHPTLPCPLTIAEQWLQARAGITPYQGPFLVHYLEMVIYPDLPPSALMAGAIAVCVFNLGVYALRFRRRHLAGW